MVEILKRTTAKFQHFKFNLRVNFVSGDLFDFDSYRVVKQLNASRNFFSKDPTVILADPFLFVHKGELYLFYEMQKGMYGKGVIRMRKTKDLKKWSKSRVVLKQKFHLSYPNVFTLNGKIFMMPETHENKSVRLYTPNKSLTKWKRYRTLIKGKDFVDSSIIVHNDIYYLFTTEYNDRDTLLRLYMSDFLKGKWAEHPQSPLKKDKNDSRCAGSLFYHEEKLYRPCQRSDETYGDGVDIYQVEKLSPLEYSEKKISNIIPNNDKFYSIGGHHFNPCEFNGIQLVATDALEKGTNIYEITRRVKSKFSKK